MVRLSDVEPGAPRGYRSQKNAPINVRLEGVKCVRPCRSVYVTVEPIDALHLELVTQGLDKGGEGEEERREKKNWKIEEEGEEEEEGDEGDVNRCWYSIYTALHSLHRL